jgi:hypothetical protein
MLCVHNLYMSQKYTRKMRFEEDPNIDYARKLFSSLYVKMGYDKDTDVSCIRCCTLSLCVLASVWGVSDGTAHSHSRSLFLIWARMCSPR